MIYHEICLTEGYEMRTLHTWIKNFFFPIDALKAKVSVNFTLESGWRKSWLKSFQRCPTLSLAVTFFIGQLFSFHVVHIYVISTNAMRVEVVMLVSLTGREICLQRFYFN